MPASPPLRSPLALPVPPAGAGRRFLTGTGLLVFLATALAGYEAFLLVTIPIAKR